MQCPYKPALSLGSPFGHIIYRADIAIDCCYIFYINEYMTFH
jgi:hypothetical protein